MHHLLARPCRALVALGATLVTMTAQATPVTYTLTGHFNGTTSDDAALVAALAPLLDAGQTLTMTLSGVAPRLWRGELGVFALNAAGGFDRASFQFNVDQFVEGSLPAALGRPLPEPGSLALILLALAALGRRQRRL